MLEAASNDDEIVKEKSLVAINRWLFSFNRSFSLPNDNQIHKIRELIHDLDGVMPANDQKELLFALPS